MNLSTDDEINFLWHVSSVFEHWQIIFELHLVTLFLLTFILKEFKSRIENDFSLEFRVALLKGKVEDLVVVFEDFIQYF